MVYREIMSQKYVDLSQEAMMANRVGVDMPSSSLSSTFSRLVPVSRSPTALLTTQLRNRESPLKYRPVSTNQSRDTLEQQRTTELGDEMRAVHNLHSLQQRPDPVIHCSRLKK